MGCLPLATHEECENLADNLTLPNKCSLKKYSQMPKSVCKIFLRLCNNPKCNDSFECMDGTYQQSRTKTCPKIKCPNNKCADSREECILSNGCSAFSPKKCSDSSCHPMTSKCPAHLVCLLFNTFLCVDFECVIPRNAV